MGEKNVRFEPRPPGALPTELSSSNSLTGLPVPIEYNAKHVLGQLYIENHRLVFGGFFYEESKIQRKHRDEKSL